MSEPNAGSDVVSMKLKAEKKGKATGHLEKAEKQTQCKGVAVGSGLCWVPVLAPRGAAAVL